MFLLYYIIMYEYMSINIFMFKKLNLNICGSYSILL